MIKQFEYSESVGIPQDQKAARAALRLLGAFDAGTALRPGTAQERRQDAERAVVGKVIDDADRR